jgi:hypothetical protein
MPTTTRHFLHGSAMLGCLFLAACNGDKGEATLTIEGSYSGTSETSCQVALRKEKEGTLQQSHALAPSFREDFTVNDGQGRYYVEVNCGGGKMGRSPTFDFEPPRASITLADIEIR